MEKPSSIGYIIAEKFFVTAFLGKGGFGNTYGGFLLPSQKEVALKIEKDDVRESLIENEARIAAMLSGAPGFPLFVDFLHLKNDIIFAMQFLGRSLGSLVDFLDHPLSLSSVYMLADQMISRIEYLHLRNYIHRDIKPDNFLLGRGNSRNCLHLIDFGLAELFRDPYSHEIYPQRFKVRPCGTPLFSSINSQLGRSMSRRDDLESLAYSLIYLAKGELPWSGSSSATAKLTISSDAAASGLPPVFAQFLSMAKHLRFEELPEYSKYRDMFREAFLEIKKDEENLIYKFEWEEMEGLEPPLPIPEMPEVKGHVRSGSMPMKKKIKNSESTFLPKPKTLPGSPPPSTSRASIGFTDKILPKKKKRNSFKVPAP